jgi:hypothetical protein
MTGGVWNTADKGGLAEDKLLLIADPAWYYGASVIGIDEHI